VRTRFAASIDDCFDTVLIDDELCWPPLRSTNEQDLLLLVIVSYLFSSEKNIFVFVKFDS
jgi:hypothetical protein